MPLYLLQVQCPLQPTDVSRSAAKPEHADREARFETDTQALGNCAGLIPEPANLPIEQIRQTVHPEPDQEAALDYLRASSSRASGIIKSVCLSSAPLTPISRLDAAEQRVDATIKALGIVRGGLANFYDSLTDEQKRRFNAMDSSTERAWPAGDIVAMCSQQVESFDLPVSRIEQVVQPTANQRGTFDELKKVTQSASEQLRSSCPSVVPLSPMARVDTATTVLRAVADATGNVTGFHNFEPEVGGKWLGVLKQIAPQVRRVGFVHVPEIAANVSFIRAADPISRPLGMTVSGLGVRDADDFERVLADFAQDGNGGLIVTPSPLTATKRDVLIGVAENLKLPTVYPFRFYVESGGLVSYGIDQLETVREAASYVDRILRGTNPADLPVQLPTKFSLVVNLKTAKGLGLSVPESFLLFADEVIE